MPKHTDIYALYEEFKYENDPILKDEGIDPNNIIDSQFTDIINEMKSWIDNL